jgi:hypothetical protein
MHFGFIYQNINNFLSVLCAFVGEQIVPQSHKDHEDLN